MSGLSDFEAIENAKSYRTDNPLSAKRQYFLIGKVVAVPDESCVSPRKKGPRDVLESRVRALDGLRTSSVDSTVRGNLGRWAADGGRNLDQIPIRRGFVRRRSKLAPGIDFDPDALVDKPKPKLPNPPPLAVLAPITKGIGLRVELSLRYLAITGDALGANAKLKLSIDGSDASDGLADLIAIPAVHRPSPNSPSVSNLRENRKRQIRDALRQLGGVQLLEIPEGGRQGEPRFDDVHLFRENGPGAAGPRRYAPPKSQENVVTVPASFFTNGWIHALSKSEIAMWLMLRDLHQNGDLPADGLRIAGRDRLLEYDLSRAVWDTHAKLEAYGLVVVHKDPNRRTNGTTIEGEWAQPHRFEITDAGLDKIGLDVVIPALRKEQDFRKRTRRNVR